MPTIDVVTIGISMFAKKSGIHSLTMLNQRISIYAESQQKEDPDPKLMT